MDKPSVVHYICYKKTDAFFTLWLNLELLVPVAIDCWIDNIRYVPIDPIDSWRLWVLGSVTPAAFCEPYQPCVDTLTFDPLNPKTMMGAHWEIRQSYSDHMPSACDGKQN